MIRIALSSIGYGSHELARDIRLDIAGGECILLAGANGCGKTTLLKALSRQHPEALFLPTGIPKVKGFTVREFIRTGCFRESRWKRSEGLEGRTAEALTALGIADLAGRDLSTLSDGQFQKACLAIALTRRADLLDRRRRGKDEHRLDAEGRRATLRTIREMSRRSGLPVLFSSHDLREALEIADRVAGITKEGQFLLSGTSDREAVLDRLFTWR